MAKKRGRKKGWSQGPRKLTNKAVKAYMERGLTKQLKANAAKKTARKTKVMASKSYKKRVKRPGIGRGAPGVKKSAAHKKAISAGMKRAWSSGKLKSRRKRARKKAK